MRAEPYVPVQAAGQVAVKHPGGRIDAHAGVLGRDDIDARGRASTIRQINRLMDMAFFPGRTPRSAEYRCGCRATLEFRIARRPVPASYAAGTAAADAFFAGAEEGHAIWRHKQDVDITHTEIAAQQSSGRNDALTSQVNRNAKVST